MAVTTGGQASTGTAPSLSATSPQHTIPATQLSIRNKLLFAQAVHRLGAPIGKSVGNNWNAVIALLRNCPVLSGEEKAIFTEHNCRGFYDDLMAEAGFPDLSTIGGLEKPNAKAHLIMAQYFYVERMKEMKSTIEDQEQQFRTLISEIDAIKSGEAIYNPVLLAELRRAVVRIRNKIHSGEPSIDGIGTSTNSLNNWIPTKDELKAAAGGRITSQSPPTQPKPSPDHENAGKRDDVTISSVKSDSPAPAISTAVSPSPTPTPTPSVVVNGEILKPYPSSEVQMTDRVDEVPPLQIQPKKPKESFVMGARAGSEKGTESGYGVPHAERPVEVKQEIPTKEPPQQDQQVKVPYQPAIRQDISVNARNGTASPSPPVSERSATAQPQRPRQIVDLRPASTSGTHFVTDTAPQSFIPIKREVISTAPKPERSSAGVYNHRKIPVKNAASHSVTSGPSLMGEKKPIIVEEPPIKDRSDIDIVVPDSQEVPDSQDEAGNDGPTNKAVARNPNKAIVTDPSPRKATRATKKAEVEQSSSTLPSQNVVPERQSDEESNRSELTTPPASPALTAPPSSAEGRVKIEDESKDIDMLSPTASSPVASRSTSKFERMSRRTSGGDDPAKGSSNRGRKRARESESGAPFTPAKRPYRKSGNTQSQDELSPAPPDESRPHSKAGDTDDAGDVDTPQRRVKMTDSDRDDDSAEVPRRGNNRRTTTRAKPPTIEEDSEADDGDSRKGRGSAERMTRRRGHKDADEASGKSSMHRRSGRFARTSPDKQQTTNTDDTVDEDGSEKASSKAYQRRKGGRFSKNSREVQADSEADSVDEDRPERSSKSSRKTQESKKDAQQLPGESRKELGRDDGPDEMETTPTQSQHMRPTGRTRSTRSTASAAPTVTSIKAFQTMINPLYEEIIAHKNGPLFLAPVRESDAPGYSKIVKQPMDLKKIKAKIRKGEISTIDEFQRDLWLIFCNAMLYNRPNSEVYRMAQEMMNWCEKKINDYRNLQHHIRQNS